MILILSAGNLNSRNQGFSNKQQQKTARSITLCFQCVSSIITICWQLVASFMCKKQRLDVIIQSLCAGLTMPNLTYHKILLLFLIQQKNVAFQPVTENNHVLVGHVFQQLYTRDWFNCIQACHDEPRCISYNYERSAGANGLCELNDCAVKSLCDRRSSLVYSKGFVFQQLRESKVRERCYGQKYVPYLLTEICNSTDKTKRGEY